jgi:purine-cytosine permease-like protein
MSVADKDFFSTVFWVIVGTALVVTARVGGAFLMTFFIVFGTGFLAVLLTALVVAFLVAMCRYYTEKPQFV